MSKMFSLDLKRCETYTIEHNGIEVVIEPLNKRQEKKLIDKFTVGRVSVLQTKTKKGFRKKENEKENGKI